MCPVGTSLVAAMSVICINYIYTFDHAYLCINLSSLVKVAGWENYWRILHCPLTTGGREWSSGLDLGCAAKGRHESNAMNFHRLYYKHNTVGNTGYNLSCQAANSKLSRQSASGGYCLGKLALGHHIVFISSFYIRSFGRENKFCQISPFHEFVTI
jgi:hypothetical protein